MKDEPTTVTLSAGGHSVTMTDAEFEQASRGRGPKALEARRVIVRGMSSMAKPSGATVDTQTGEVLSDHETLDKLAAHEQELAAFDTAIGKLAQELKYKKEAREDVVAHMRKLIRREPLPLFEDGANA